MTKTIDYLAERFFIAKTDIQFGDQLDKKNKAPVEFNMKFISWGARGQVFNWTIAHCATSEAEYRQLCNFATEILGTSNPSDFMYKEVTLIHAFPVDGLGETHEILCGIGDAKKDKFIIPLHLFWDNLMDPPKDIFTKSEVVRLLHEFNY